MSRDPEWESEQQAEWWASPPPESPPKRVYGSRRPVGDVESKDETRGDRNTKDETRAAIACDDREHQREYATDEQQKQGETERFHLSTWSAGCVTDSKGDGYESCQDPGSHSDRSVPSPDLGTVTEEDTFPVHNPWYRR